MNYKKELNRLRKRRREYRPTMAMLMNMHRQTKSSDFPLELIDRKDVPIILELLDIGYLDVDALIVKRRFGNITGLSYNGGYPFTESGDFFFLQSGSPIERTIRKMFRALFNNADIRPQ